MSAPSARSPAFSVVLTAFHRKEFLPTAVRSVLAQTFPADQFEIIVSKNFDDPLISAMLRGRAVTEVDCGEAGQGGMVDLALAQARGEFVAFLDDDDAWHPDKLAWLSHEFNADPSLGYARNGVVPVDAQDRVLPGVGGPEERGILEAMGGPRLLLHPGKGAEEATRRMAAANPGNGSSVAVRRSVLEPFRPVLRQLPVAIDTFFFYAALLGSPALLFDRRPLTRLRIHQSNLTRPGGSSYQEYFDRYRRGMAAEARAYGLLAAMAESRGPTWLRDLLDGYRRKFEHLAEIGSAHPSRGEAARRFLEFSARGSGAKWGEVLSAGLLTFSPGVCRATTYLWATRRWKR